MSERTRRGYSPRRYIYMMTNEQLAEAEKLAQGARRAVEAERKAAENWGGLPVTPGSAFIDTCGYYTAHTLETLIAEVKRLQAENAELVQDLTGMVEQHLTESSHGGDSWIHSSGISANEAAISTLVNRGILRQRDGAAMTFDWVKAVTTP